MLIRLSSLPPLTRTLSPRGEGNWDVEKLLKKSRNSKGGITAFLINFRFPSLELPKQVRRVSLL